MVGREQGSGFRNAVNPFLLRIPASQESPARTSLSGRSHGCESPPDFRSSSPLEARTRPSRPRTPSNHSPAPCLVLSGIGVKKGFMIVRLRDDSNYLSVIPLAPSNAENAPG